MLKPILITVSSRLRLSCLLQIDKSRLFLSMFDLWVIYGDKVGGREECVKFEEAGGTGFKKYYGK